MLFRSSHVEAPREVERETLIEVVTQTRAATPEPQTPHRYDEVPPRIDPAQAATPPPQLADQTTRTTTINTRRALPAKTPESPTPNAQSPVIEKQEPTIHISIGRIEVRAVTPPAAPRRESTRAPMSIDEYVARRDANGGGQ